MPDAGARLDYLAEKLVADDVSGPHRRQIAADKVQVGTADRAQLHLHDRVLRVEQLWLGDLLDGHVVNTLPAQGLHSGPSPRARPSRRSSGRPVSVGLLVEGRSGRTTSPVSRIDF